MRYTVLGASGYVGSHLVDELERRGHEVLSPPRGSNQVFQEKLGEVIYTIGMTSDARAFPFATTEAHVGFLSEVLQRADFDSLLYLSSTRVYLNAERTEEHQSLLVNPTHSDQIFNLSKLLGENLCLKFQPECVRVARVSNVYGGRSPSPSFLTSVLKDALTSGHVEILTAANSAKDYIFIDDLVDLLIDVASRGTQKLYNLASGANTENRVITDMLRELLDVDVSYRPDAPTVRFPAIKTKLIREEFGYKPSAFKDKFREMLEQTQP